MTVIGDAVLIILICYVLAGLTTAKKVSIYTVISYLIVLVILHLLLLR